MSEFYLTLMAFVYICLAAWRNSVPAVLFGILMFSHAIFLGYLVDTDRLTHVDTDTLNYMVTGGIFSTLAMAACYGFRTSVNDVIAFRMGGISAACLFTNIVCIIVWLTESPMGGFTWVFAAILLASIVVILKGDKDGLGSGTRSHLGSDAHHTADQVSDMVVGLENREASE